MAFKMDDAEFDQMLRLIKRFANTDMDQWAAWRFENEPYGSIYVTISNAPGGGTEEDHYTLIEVPKD